MKALDLDKISSQLFDFIAQFHKDFGRSERRHWCKVYLSGLILDGDRKSIEPLAKRVKGGNTQALQQFVNQSPWDSNKLMSSLREFTQSQFKEKLNILILDDTSLPKHGNYSVGVAHQYCGVFGKLANCQSIVTWHGCSSKHHIPLSARLYLPESWTSNKSKLDRGKVPEEYRFFKEKWKIALNLLDEMQTDTSRQVLLFDSGYGAWTSPKVLDIF